MELPLWQKFLFSSVIAVFVIKKNTSQAQNMNKGKVLSYYHYNNDITVFLLGKRNLSTGRGKNLIKILQRKKTTSLLIMSYNSITKEFFLLH